MALKSLPASPLIRLATLVLIVASMYWSRAVLMPVALAVLLTFLLSPVDTAFQRLGLGRIGSVVVLTILTFAFIAIVGWMISAQIKEFANQLPKYQDNLKKRISSIEVGRGQTPDKILGDFTDWIDSLPTNETTQSDKPVPVTVQNPGTSGLSQLSKLVMSLLESLFNILLVVILVIFMLLEREELRNRVIRLLGRGRSSLTSQALDEAGQRVSRYLFSQFIVNLCVGTGIGLGLFLLGVPYALLWGFLIVILRFLPYLGIWIAAVFPLALSLATSAGWWQPLSVMVLFAVLEPIAGFVIEPMVFSQNAGVSRLMMLIAIAFWSWLWGPIGLLLATPLTACLAVAAKYVPQMDFIAVLLSDEKSKHPRTDSTKSS